MSCLTVQRIAVLEQITQAGQRIVHLQQRPAHVVAKPAEQLFGRGAEVDHPRPAVQFRSVGRAQDRTATGGKYTRITRTQLTYHLFFDIAETRLSLALEELTDRATYALLDHMIGVNEWQLKPPCELTPDCGFTGAGKTYQTNQLKRSQGH